MNNVNFLSPAFVKESINCNFSSSKVNRRLCTTKALCFVSGSYLHDVSSHSRKKVDMQMFEIQNELITDLLVAKRSSNTPLELDETPALGVHVKVRWQLFVMLSDGVQNQK